ncbi:MULTISPECIES: flavin reductase family protein [Variovorax]|jgi:flavin reductase (DIM6/NTAB) family NADH-FMN oxidoreductase RutF|uniref:flavin reductase family protein n=1 Tax=Variovorax TaxID=34072 RepID=UPI00086A2AFE|nr:MULTISPECIES: flavin reductase family protein [Variovorax]MBN8754500.1 flavin reductase family protein [Variovorax sp.]ODU17544.1 MAG: flavin reductase [Variovorax sp. SCN 67-85]ODV24229.1 MAG: flavin reductase [Variovorax sp. SCN 67-20]OJZ04105.1 MAG: flavin reductase [Variovorax sp. 67-131]UKI10019.1 flavin reductase family protein [Variovorax paradoxus]
MNASHRLSVPLDKAYRLLNHGPTVLVSAAHGGQRNIMAAAWAMPLDFAPPKVAVVLDKSTWTRVLLEGAGSFALQVPTRAQLDLTEALGNSSGREIVEQSGHDKFAAYGLQTFAGTATDAPLLEGCAAWLECRLLPEPHIQQSYDLFLGEVIAAQADSRVFANGRWNFDGHDELRTLHHVAGGHFIVDGEAVDARPLPPVRS